LNSDIFEGFSAKEVRDILAVMPYKTENYEQGKIIVAQGDKLARIGIIIDGSVLASKLYDDENASCSIVRRYEQSDIIGLFFAYSRSQISSHMFTADQDSTVLWFEWMLLESAAIMHISDALHKKLIDNIFAISADNLISLDVKAEVRGERGAEAKILRYLYEMSTKKHSDMIDIHMTQPEFAAYLAVGRPTLNIALHKLRETGVIDYKKSTFTILDYGALMARKRKIGKKPDSL
jgi:CRP-like cAMP-binding protein